MISKKILFLVVTASMLFNQITFAAESFKSIKELDTHIKKSGFNGAILVMKGSKTLMRGAFGYRDIETKTPLHITDKFQIGSNTKQIVAAAVLKLQEQGKLSLEDEVTKYLPEYTRFNEIKVRDLLNHTSGIVNYTEHTDFMASRTYKKVLTLDDIIDHVSKFKLDFKPRTKWKYSNGGFIVAGKIIELASGVSWNAYVKREILDPFDMNDTDHNVYFEKVSKVRGHLNGSVVRNLNLSWALSAGSLHSTVDDMAKWLSIYGDSKILDNDSKKEMQKSFLNSYALGIFSHPYGFDHILSHAGVTRGFYSKTFYLKKSKIKIVTIENMNGLNKDIPDLVLKHFYKNY
jgi:CubicO group peptidase (beta-lactamase class C family)